MKRWIAVALLLILGACTTEGSGTTTSTEGSQTPSTPANPATTTTVPEVTTTSARPATTSTQSTTTTIAATVTVDAYLPSASSRSLIPWSDVGPGWYVVLYDASKAHPADSTEVRDGPVVLYLVDSAGNRYEVTSWPADDRPWNLIDATSQSALAVGTGATIDGTEYEFVDLTSGVTTAVHTVSFPESTYPWGWAASLTRPTGANTVVYRSDGTHEWLERRSSDGTMLTEVYRQAYVDSFSALAWMYGHDGTFLLVTHHGGIAEVSNTGTTLGQIWVPPDTRCEPTRWWDSDTFLAACYGQGPASAPLDDFGNPHTFYGRLWLLETDGTAGIALTDFPSTPPIVVDFGYHDAWPVASETYLQWSGDCGASSVALLETDGSGTFLPMSTPTTLFADGVEMVDIVNGQIAVYGWQGCDAWVGSLFITDLAGNLVTELVPVLGDARGVIGVRGLATVYP